MAPIDLCSPRLCEKCQVWNNVALLSSYHQNHKFTDYFSLPALEESYVPKCLICDAVSAAVRTRLTCEREAGRVVPAPVRVFNLGPSFLDYKHTLEHRIDYSQPSESKMRMLIRINVADCLFLAPRFCLRHTRTVPPQLFSVDPWESTFFDINLLRTWIRTCEEIHMEKPLSSAIPCHGSKSAGPGGEPLRRAPESRLLKSLVIFN